MAQYCRYCTFMHCGDANWCSKKKVTFTDEKIRRTNTCKFFDFNPIDALGINTEGYSPRKPKEPQNEQNKQINLFDEV